VKATMLRFIAFFTLLCSLVANASILPAQEQEKPIDKTSQSSLRAQALVALKNGDYDTAVHAADAMLREYPKDAAALRRAADIFLRAGKPIDSVRLFDKYLKMNPGAEPELWQRGIGLYFIGEYGKAAEQFVLHREANPHDVENAAWHFLCVAKGESFDIAKKGLLPAPGDSRVPMKEIYDMLRTGDEEAITKAIEQLPENTEGREEAAFNGDLYRGLYADAKGDTKKAKEYLDRAANRAPSHYMGDVAKVYSVSIDE
jgi:lipoprotein NlpI